MRSVLLLLSLLGYFPALTQLPLALTVPPADAGRVLLAGGLGTLQRR